MQLLQHQSHPCCYNVACRDCSAAPPWFIFRAATALSTWLRSLPRKLEPAPIAMLAELNGMMSSQVVSALPPALATRPSSRARAAVFHSGEPHFGVMRHVRQTELLTCLPFPATTLQAIQLPVAWLELATSLCL